MIVTRKRKKRFPWRRVLLPVSAVTLLVAALSWAPSRTWIATGPLAPLWNSPPAKAIATPFDGLAQQRHIAAQEREIASLQTQLADARSQINERAKQTSQLQSQLNDAQQQAAQASAIQARPPERHAAQPKGGPIDNQPVGPTPDIQRTAQVWAAMDSESAAKIVEKLPQDYVARVFAAMSPESVGAILENLPASFAANLTQEHPELKR